MAELLYRLGRLAARRARTVIAAWLGVLAVAGLAFALAGGTLANSFSIPGTPTAEVTERLQADLPEVAGGTGTVVLRTKDGSPFTVEQTTAIVGDGAWWLPRWLDRLLPDVDVEGASLERRHPHHVPEQGVEAEGGTPSENSAPAGGILGRRG